MLDGKTNTSDEKDGILSMTESVNGGRLSMTGRVIGGILSMDGGVKDGRLDGVGSELVREWFGKGYENYA